MNNNNCEQSINIMVVGKVSSGKSSFINSLVGGYISPVSLNRQTFNPIVFKLTTNGTFKNVMTISKNIEKQYNEAKKNREELNKYSNYNEKLEEKYTTLDKNIIQTMTNCIQKYFFINLIFIW